MSAKISYTHRLEIKFDHIPSTFLRGEMKDRGFQYDGRGQVWHLARPVNFRPHSGRPIYQDGFLYALEFCVEFLGMNRERIAEITAKRDGEAHRIGIMAMEEACGIA